VIHTIRNVLGQDSLRFPHLAAVDLSMYVVGTLDSSEKKIREEIRIQTRCTHTNCWAPVTLEDNSEEAVPIPLKIRLLVPNLDLAPVANGSMDPLRTQERWQERQP